ncbi:MAG: hypothetical protein WBL93_04310 [Lutisporaceae bacterium]
MKYSKWVAVTVIISLMFVNIVAADTYTSKQSLIETAIKNSSELLLQRNSLNSLKENLHSLNYYVEHRQNEALSYQRYYYLIRMEKHTLEEMKEIEQLQSIIFVPLSENEKTRVVIDTKNNIYETEYAIFTAQNNENSIKNNIYMSINELYSELLKIDTAISNQKLSIQKLNLNYRNAKLKLYQGKISQSDYKKISLTLNISNVGLEKLNKQRKVVEHKLNRYLGSSQAISIITDRTLEESYKKLDSLQYYLDYAIAHNIQMLNATKYYSFTEQKYQSSKQIEHLIGSRLTDDSMLSMENAGYELEEIKLDTYIQVNNLYNTILNDLNQIERTNQLYEYYKYKNNEGQNKYKLGQISEYELSQNNLNYYNSIGNYYNARIDAELTYQKLLNICGFLLY